MAVKTILEKAGETAGFGMAMASDLAGTVKTAFESAVATVTDVINKTPAKNTVEKTATKSVTRKGAKKTPAKTIVKRATTKTPAKKAARKAPAKRSPRNS